MAVKIRLKRLGKIRAPYYRIVVADSRTRRDGRAIEEIGLYHPTEEPSRIVIDSERALYWLGVGAQPTEQVAVLLKITGDWQKYKGLPGQEGTLRVAPPKPDRKAAYEAAMRDAKSDAAATTPRKKAAKPEAEAPKAEAKADAKTDAKTDAKADAKTEAPEAGDTAAAAPVTEPAEAPATEAPAPVTEPAEAPATEAAPETTAAEAPAPAEDAPKES